MPKFINTELKPNSDAESSDRDLRPSGSDLRFRFRFRFR